MPGRQLKPEHPEAVLNNGDDFYQSIAKLLSFQPIAASQGILLDIHIDPRIPAQAHIGNKLARKTLLPILTQTIEHEPWSRLDISFQLIKVISSQYHVEMNIRGNGCPLRQYGNNHNIIMQHNSAANSNDSDIFMPRTAWKNSGNSGPHLLATSRFKVQSNSEQSFVWQVNDPSHEATLVLSDDPALGKRVDADLNRYHIMTSQADSLTNACRTIVSNNHKMTYTTILVDAQIGDKTLNKYSPLLHDVASPGTKFILLTHNEINHSLIQKYHTAGYFAVVNLESETELANAIYASTQLYATGTTAKKCNLAGKFMA